MFQLIVLTVNNPVQHHDHPRMLLLLVGVLLLQRLHLLVVVEQLPPPQLLLNLVELGQTQPSVLFDCLHLLIVLVLGVLDFNPVLVMDAPEVSEVLFSNSLKSPLPLVVLVQLVHLEEIIPLLL